MMQKTFIDKKCQGTLFPWLDVGYYGLNLEPGLGEGLISEHLVARSLYQWSLSRLSLNELRGFAFL